MPETGINRTELKKRHAAIYERRLLQSDERNRAQRSADGIRAKIVKFFMQMPDARISPSEFKDLMQLPNPIHGVRPRFTDLNNENWLERIDTDRVQSGYGGTECRYRRANENGQLSLL